MTTLAQLIYNYAQNYRLPSFLDRDAIDLTISDQAHTLAVLKKGLSAQQLETLEQYQKFCRRQQELEMEAMFLTAFSVARELWV